MNQKELTKTFMMLSNRKNPLLALCFTNYFSALRVKASHFLPKLALVVLDGFTYKMTSK